MSNTLYVVVDISGSMIEMAKISISMNILSFIREYDSIHQNFDKIIILKWSEGVEIIELDKDNELENFIPSGKLNFSSLQDELAKINTEEIPMRILLLSDGNSDSDELNDFAKWCSSRSNLYMVPIAIGADADFDKLNKTSYNKYVYSPEDILTAVKSLEITSKDRRKILSINDIIDLQANEDFEAW